MTKFSVSKWDESKTIQENADKLGLNYYYASEIARTNNLSFKRKNGGKVLRELLYKPVKEASRFRPDKPYHSDGQTFEGSGAD